MLWIWAWQFYHNARPVFLLLQTKINFFSCDLIYLRGKIACLLPPVNQKKSKKRFVVERKKLIPREELSSQRVALHCRKYLFTLSELSKSLYMCNVYIHICIIYVCIYVKCIQLAFTVYYFVLKRCVFMHRTCNAFYCFCYKRNV